MTPAAGFRSGTLPAAILCLVAGCREGPAGGPTDPTAPVLTLARVSGDSQIGEPGRLLEEFLVFRVTDAAGRPVPGLRVEWEIVTGSGRVSGKRHETDLDGLAAGNFTLGLEPGEHVARGIVHDSLSIAFTAFAQPGPPGAPLPSRPVAPR
jgi:hypothetical protein